MDTARILLVDDDKATLADVSAVFSSPEYEMRTAGNAEDALEAMKLFTPDLVILDVVLPEEFLRTGERADGLSVLRQMRKLSDVPILMLSATGLAPIKVLALDSGADDYMTKPFDSRELAARVNALLRRQRGDFPTRKGPDPGRLQLDTVLRIVRHGDRTIELTPIEFSLLETLTRRPGRTFSRRDLINLAWRGSYYGDERVVDTHIASLRKKIEPNPSSPQFVITVHGVGYRADIEGV